MSYMTPAHRRFKVGQKVVSTPLALKNGVFSFHQSGVIIGFCDSPLSVRIREMVGNLCKVIISTFRRKRGRRTPPMNADRPKVLEIPPGCYVSMAEMGHCKICGAWKDLRMGACFGCSSKVTGRSIDGGHELWEIENPLNKWRVVAQ